jgi:acyl carrier protein
MTQEEIFRKVSEVIAARKGVQPSAIQLSSSFEELNMDSLDSVELISDLEEFYNVSIPNQELLAIKTVNEAVNSLGKLVNG